MKSLTILLCVVLLSVSHLFAKEKAIPELNTEQKLADFDSLYYTLKRVYPYFGVLKRKNDVDWLGNYEQYRETIKNSKNDKEFIANISAIVNDLHCDHADLMPTTDFDYFYKLYKRYRLLKRSIKRGYKELKNENARNNNKHWTNLLNKIREEKYGKKESSSSDWYNKKVNSQLTITSDTINKIVYIHLPSFVDERIYKDKARLDSFFTNISQYNRLIIDIQGNTGGNDSYWIKYVVPYLIENDVTTENIIAYRKDRIFYEYYNTPKKELTYSDVKLDNMPEELKGNDYGFMKREMVLYPKKVKSRFKGDIYLLVDELVFSSSEAFAIFCKQTKFAKVVGKQTGGDGIGSEPFLLCLPNSGIVMRYTGEMGLNSDGSSNAELCTMPDVELKGKESDECLSELMKMIKNGEI
ncbi:MAG: S41 family peptidase [Bacteroidales bacterium]|jgi:hypothetical protein|nr:S41 family peptidase [Bacteroidales bacterium]